MSEENLEGLVIDETNFDQYFFDAKKHTPKKGQVMARYTATAYLEDGNLKRDLISLLSKSNKAEAASRVMKVLGGATAKDSYRVPKEMAIDLAMGMSEDEVAKKPYKYTFETVYWAAKGVVPENDPHWYTIPVLTWGKEFDEKYADLKFLDDDNGQEILAAKEGFSEEGEVL